jgi:dihydrofolate reductase
MAKLIYTAIASLDGYIEDERGNFDWGEPDEEVHSFVNDLERPIGTYLYGRRLYETMVAWETLSLAEEPPHIREFAELWRKADKIVYSNTLESTASARTRLERTFDPEAVEALKAEADRDLSVGGGALGSTAFAAGLVDELRLFLAPVVVGGGKRALSDGLRLKLELQEERPFGSGFVYVRYRVVHA